MYLISRNTKYELLNRGLPEMDGTPKDAVKSLDNRCNLVHGAITGPDQSSTVTQQYTWTALPHWFGNALAKELNSDER